MKHFKQFSAHLGRFIKSFFLRSNKLFKRFNFLKFQTLQLVKSKIIIIFLIVLLCLPFATLIPLNLLADIFSYLGIYLVVSVFSLVIFDFILIYKQFVDNVLNQTDKWLIAKAFNLKQVFWIRTLIVLTCNLIICFIQSLLALFIELGFHAYSISLGIWVITLFAQFFIATSLLLLFLLIAIKCNQIWYIAINILVIIFLLVTYFVTALFAPRLDQNNEIKYGPNYANSYSLITNSNNDIKIAINKNPLSSSSTNTNEDYFNAIDNVNPLGFISPGLWFISPAQTMFSGSFKFDNDFNLLINHAANNYQFSLLRFYYNSSVTNQQYFNNNSTSPYFNYPIDLVDIFNLEPIQLETKLVNTLQEAYSTYFETKKIDDLLLLYNNINDVKIWNNNFFINNPSELQLMKSIMGLNEQSKMLFYFYENYAYLIKNIPSFYQTLSEKTNPDYANLVKYIYTTQNSYDNYFELRTVDPNINDILLNYPSLQALSLGDQPKREDIDFFKNSLIRFNSNGPEVLLSDYSYVPINLASLDPSLTTLAAWTQYVDNDAISVQNLINTYNQIKEINQNTFDYKFTANIINQYKFIDLLTANQKPWFEYGFIFLIIEILLPFIVLPYLATKYKNKNFK